MYASDAENNSAAYNTDKSNITTDDEFYDELMTAPPEYEDCLVPDKCKSELFGIEHLVKCLNRRFGSYPAVFMGTLNDALKEAFSWQKIEERRPFLIFVNHDKSVYTNLFCKKLLCKERIIEYLMDNYVLWAWDVTFESNAQKLDDLFNGVFSPWTNDKLFTKRTIDQYPLLMVVHHTKNGDLELVSIIEGSNTQMALDELLNSLIKNKNAFFEKELAFEKAKEDARQQRLLEMRLQRSMFHHRSKRRPDDIFTRSISMYSYLNPSNRPYSNTDRLARLYSGGIPENSHSYASSLIDHLTEDELQFAFERISLEANDADDEDEQMLKTPTIDHPSPKLV